MRFYVLSAPWVRGEGLGFRVQGSGCGASSLGFAGSRGVEFVGLNH